jgi:hypothetical protein
MKLITAAILAIAVTTAQAQTNAMDPIWGSRGSGRTCTNPMALVPKPLPWWAIPSKDGSYAIVPMYFCSPRWTGGKGTFQSCASDYERCEYDFAISEVLGRCRTSQDAMPMDVDVRRCVYLLEKVTKVNPTFCQSYEDICPRVD